MGDSSEEARSNSDPEAGGRGTEAFQMWEIGAWKGRRERRWCLAANMGGSDFDQRPRAQPFWDHLLFRKIFFISFYKVKHSHNVVHT